MMSRVLYDEEGACGVLLVMPPHAAGFLLQASRFTPLGFTAARFHGCSLQGFTPHGFTPHASSFTLNFGSNRIVSASLSEYVRRKKNAIHDM